MTNLLLAPHNDDETLFACYTLLREQPRVIVCLRSMSQRLSGISYRTREAETEQAMNILGIDWHQLPIPDVHTDWAFLRATLRRFLLDWPKVVYAPAPNFERNGHSPEQPSPNGWGILQHDMIGHLASQVFGRRVVFYQTYTRWEGRTKEGTLVPCEPSWPELKQQALACYRSQMREPSTRSWFTEPELREWYA